MLQRGLILRAYAHAQYQETGVRHSLPFVTALVVYNHVWSVKPCSHPAMCIHSKELRRQRSCGVPLFPLISYTLFGVGLFVVVLDVSIVIRALALLSRSLLATSCLLLIT